MRVPGLVWDWLRSQWGRSLPDCSVFSVAPEAPPALETLRVVQLGEHSLRLRWQPVPGAQGFRLRWRPEGERCPPMGWRVQGPVGAGLGAGLARWARSMSGQSLSVDGVGGSAGSVTVCGISQ